MPVVTLAIIGGTAAVWWMVQGAGMSTEALTGSVCSFGAIPAEITGPTDGGGGSQGPCRLGGLTWEALATSIFLHGGWAHILGNLWFLWIFGNNVEDSMGHLRFVVFYLVTGLAAALSHVVMNPDSTVPMVGASGAISGIMGAYLVLYPRARIDTLFWVVFIIRVIPLPAWVMLGYWMVIQLAGSAASGVAGGGGVAYAAHIGGFIAGVLLIFPFRNPRLVDAKHRGVKLSRSELDHEGWW